MKILSIDTASNICGVSILENDNLIIQLDTDTGRTHSENLMPMISDAFKKSNLQLKDIDLIVCDKGPGSFTGIRIGIASCKAFCDSLDIKGIGISSLEALAYNVKNDGFIFSIIDCKNNNCYYSLFNKKDNEYTEIIKPSTSSVETALALALDLIKKDTQPITFVGDGSIIYKNEIEATFKNPTFANSNQNNLNSYNLALAGISKFNKNEIDPLLPMYLKKPQAQKQLEERLQKNEHNK